MIPAQTNPEKCMIIKDENGTFGFNIQHDYNVWKVRKDRGLPCNRQECLSNHPLKGQKLLNYSNGKTYDIVDVYREWHCGWFVKLLIEHNESHAVIYWENINCFDDYIIETIKNHRKECEILIYE